VGVIHVTLIHTALWGVGQLCHRGLKQVQENQMHSK
jgi:hypothetical protein